MGIYNQIKDLSHYLESQRPSAHLRRGRFYRDHMHRQLLRFINPSSESMQERAHQELGAREGGIMKWTKLSHILSFVTLQVN